MSPRTHLFSIFGIIILTFFIGSCELLDLTGTPTADAGEDQTVFVGELVTLDGSGSSDPESQELYYEWSFNSVPLESVLTDLDIEKSEEVIAYFTPDVPGTYIIQLYVDDPDNKQSTDTVTIFAEDAGGGGATIPAGVLSEWLFSQGSLLDSSGNAYNGTEEGTLTLAADRFGTEGEALTLGGSGYVSVAYSAALPNASYSISVSMWIKADYANESNLGYLFSLNRGDAFGEMHIQLINGHIYLISGGTSTVLLLSYGSVFTSNSWVHIVVTYDTSSESASLYYDNTLGGTYSLAFSDFAISNLQIGYRQGGSIFNGDIDDVRVYDRILTSQEISDLFNE